MDSSFELQVLSEENIPDIEPLFLDVFTHEPWNDDWSDKNQLRNYLTDIIGNRNSLALGLFGKGEICGLSLGNIIHWCTGTEYYIREFLIARKEQSKGIGSLFVDKIQEYLLRNEIKTIVLSTEMETPAFNFYIRNNFKVLDKTRFLYKSFSVDES